MACLPVANFSVLAMTETSILVFRCCKPGILPPRLGVYNLCTCGTLPPDVRPSVRHAWCDTLVPTESKARATHLYGETPEEMTQGKTKTKLMMRDLCSSWMD